MAMVGNDLWTLIYNARKAARDAVVAAYQQGSNAANAVALSNQLLSEDSKAIATTVVGYIQANAKATGVDVGTYGGDTHNLSIE